MPDPSRNQTKTGTMRRPFRQMRAFSLIEAVLAIGLFSLLASGLFSLVIVPLATSGMAQERARAAFLVEEGLEATRSIRNEGWIGVQTAGTYGLAKAAKWSFSGISDVTVDGNITYTRTITLSDVNRNGSGDIVSPGGTRDPRTMRATATVTWMAVGGINRTVRADTYLTDWNVFDWRQSTDTDFNPGTKISTAVVGIGESAAVELSSATKIWNPLGGSGIVHTTDTDWNSGTYSGTQDVGTGTPASVTETATSAWTNYAQPRTWYETLDTDFSDGTFSNTTVVDTGDLGAISLNNAIDWNTSSSPTISDLNDVFMFSTSSGWAVGNDGVIARWDGASWALFIDLGTHMFRGIDCVSAADCWAVADSGRIARWDGATWSQFVDLGGQVFQDVKMISATEGYAVAGGGVIYRWNGVSWILEASTVTDDLTGIAGTVPAAVPGTISETTDTDFSDGTFSNTEVVGTGVPAAVELTDQLNWLSRTAPQTANPYMDVSMVSLTFGMAVGGATAAARVARWDGTSWATVAYPNNRLVSSVKMNSTTDGWAVGNRASVMARWNGVAWVDVADVTNWGNNAMYGVDCWDTTHCMAVGYTGYYTYWNGVSWTARTSTGITGSPIIRGVKFYDATHVIVVAANGAIWRGTYAAGWTWANMTSGIAIQLNDVDCLSATDCVAVGNVTGGAAVIRRWNGVAWSGMTSGTASALNAVDMLAANDMVAVGAAGTIRRWNGTTWSAMTSPTVAALNGIAMISTDYGIAVGASGGTPASTIFEYGYHYSVSGTYLSDALDAGSAVSWDILSWTETLPALTNLTIATRTGPTATPDGSWSAWSAENTVPAGVAITSPRNRYIQYRATLTTTNNLVTPSLDSVSLTYDASQPGLFAVSTAGTILGRNGASWTQIIDLGTHVFGGVDCVSATDCWAVADSGRIARWDGATWSQFVDLGAQTFNAVRMVSASSGWAVGSAGEIFRWNGVAWSSVASPTAASLNGIAMTSSTYGFAVGAAGTVLEYGFHYYSSGYYLSDVKDTVTTSAWVNLSWDQLLPAGTTLTVAIRTGPSATPDGTWTGWSAEYNTPAGVDISGLTADRYIQYRASLTTIDRFVTGRLNSITITYNSPPAGDYYDLYMSSPTDGWGAGCDTTSYTTGSVIHWDGTGWSSWATPELIPSVFPTSLPCLDGMGGSGPNDVWAVDFNGDYILRWNGTVWSAYNVTALTAGTYIYDIKCLDASDCRAAGTNGLMLRWNGTAWSAETSNTAQNIEWIGYVAANDVWASASGGQILHYNGAVWSVFATYGTTSWHGIFMLSATDGWMVGGNTTGTGAAIRRWNGATWNVVASPTAIELQNVYCISSSFCWAAGGYQSTSSVILKWDGSVWATVADPVGVRIKAVWGDTPTHAWAVANDKNFLEFRSNYPAGGTWTSPPLDSGAAGMVWNSIAWDSIRPPTTNLTIATRTGAGPNCAITAWSAWSAEMTNPGGSDILSPANRCMQYRATFASGNLVDTARLDEVRIVYDALTVKPLYGIQGSAVDNVFAVGDNGVLAGWNGTLWALQTSPYASTWRDVDVLTATDALVVGAFGRTAQWDGLAWNIVASPTTEELMAVDLRIAADGFAVGTGGAIIRWDGLAWSNIASPTANALGGVSMISAADGFAVGTGGVIIRWDGAAWNAIASPTTDDLNDVHCLDATHCWAVGEAGAIIRWNGMIWSNMASPIVSRLHSVEARSASEAWAVGDFGAILRWDGASWASTTSPTTRNLYDITVNAPTDGWICGDAGQLLKDPPTYPPTGNFISAVLDTDIASSVFMSAFFTAVLPVGTTCTVATRSGNIAVPDGTWSAWSPESSAMFGFVVASPAAQYFQYRATLNTSDPGATPSFQDITVTYSQ